MVYEPAARRRRRRDRSTSRTSVATMMPIPGRARLSTGRPATPNRAMASSPGGRAAGGQLRGQVRGEPLDDLASYLDHHPPAELGGPPGDVHRRMHGDPGLAAQVLER